MTKRRLERAASFRFELEVALGSPFVRRRAATLGHQTWTAILLTCLQTEKLDTLEAQSGGFR